MRKSTSDCREVRERAVRMPGAAFIHRLAAKILARGLMVLRAAAIDTVCGAIA